MSYNDAVSYTESQQQPGTISCRDNSNFYYHYEQEPGTSIVLEVRLMIIDPSRGAKIILIFSQIFCCRFIKL